MTSKNTETTKADQDLTASNPAAQAEHSMAAASPAPKAEHSTAAANPITEGVIWQQILFFFFPLLLSSFFQQLYNTADALIVGRTAGKEALSAVGGSSGSVLIIFIMFYVGFAGGASVPAARFFGAKNERDLQETIRLSLLISSVLGIVGTVICFGGARVILTAMHTPADILDLSVSYLRIVAPGLIPSALYNMEAAALRAMGDSRRPLAVLIFTCLTNIGLDLLLVAVLGMGAVGAGIAWLSCEKKHHPCSGIFAQIFPPVLPLLFPLTVPPLFPLSVPLLFPPEVPPLFPLTVPLLLPLIFHRMFHRKNPPGGIKRGSPSVCALRTLSHGSFCRWDCPLA